MNAHPLLTKAEQYIDSAQMLADIGDFDSAISRLYYAMFYIAEALLDRLGLTFSSHHAVIAAYGLHFAKTNRLESHYHRALMDAFEKRQLADYVVDSGFTQDDVANVSNSATAFLVAAHQWLENNPPTSS